MEKNSLTSYWFGRLFGMNCKKDPIKSLYEGISKSSVYTPIYNTNEISADSQPEATNVFDQQVAGWSAKYDIDRVVGEVLWSDDDHLRGNGEVSATYKITPLHAFDDQAGHGDYYIVDATYTIMNKNMYQPNHVNHHGWVWVRIGGFCLTNCQIETSIYDKNGKVDGVKLFASSPKPETYIQEKTYTINDSWNIGGSVTGGIKKSAGEKGGDPECSTEGSIQATFNWGVSHSKTESYKVSDLTIRNNSNTDTVAYDLINNNVVHFDWSCDCGLSDCADFAKSSLIFHSAWIWYIPGARDKDESNKLTIKTTMIPRYRSCRFYSTGADYDEWHDEFKRSGDIQLELPNRIPSGTVALTNDTDETITNVSIYRENGDIEYQSKSSFTKGSVAKFNIPTGSFNMKYKRGKSASDMKEYVYVTDKFFDISRGDTISLAAGFDFDYSK